MRSGLTHPPRVRIFVALVALVSFALLATKSFAQASASGSSGPMPSGIDVYAGYGYFQPFGSDIGYRDYETIHLGAVVSVTGYFNRTLGLQVEGSLFPEASNDNNCVYTAQVGPVLRRQRGRLVPFFHALGGGAKVGGPSRQRCNVWGWGVTGGGGLDYILPYFNDRFAVRPLEVDFNYSHIDNGVFDYRTYTGGLGEIYAFRFSAGVVVRFAGITHKPHDAISLSCSATPTEIFAGDTVNLSASVQNLRSPDKTQYLWTSSGGHVSGNSADEKLVATGLAPGIYNVGARLVQGKQSRELASCTSSFAVHAIEPPTLSCSADRAAINSGDPVIITAAGFSPQNRPLTYTYSSNVGQISGNGPTASLLTAGTPPGTISVSCTVTDDKGQAAAANVFIVVATPAPAPPAPQPKGLCALSFERDAKRPNRVDNEAKGCLDDIALTLNRDPGARLLIVGNHADGEAKGDGAERALNAAEYLTLEKGIDRTRLELRVGESATRTVSTILVPTGAVLDSPSGSSFDAGSINRHGQPYGKRRAIRTRPAIRRRPAIPQRHSEGRRIPD